MVKLGSLDQNLRLNYLLSQASYFEFERELKKKYMINSVFVSVYEHIKKHIKS